MLAPRQERPSQQTRPFRRIHLGRLASVLALVAGLSGASTAAAESGSAARAFGSTDQYTTALTAAADFVDALRAIPSGTQPGLYDEDDDNEEAEEEEEGQEDGLLPGGQAEQRVQGLGDKAESRDEDHENSGGE